MATPTTTPAAPSPIWPPMPESLAGRTVVVVGGSSGIGLAAAKLLRGVGAQVVLVARDASRLAAAASSIRASGDSAAAPELVRTLIADGTDEDQLRQILAPLDGIDHVLITAATVAFGSLVDTRIVRGAASVESRLWSAYAAARVAADRLSAGGSLTFCSGDLIARPQPGASLVAAGLGAVEALARALALELAPQRVRVNTLRFGTIDTALLRGFLGHTANMASMDADNAVAQMGEALPLGRIGTAEEAASAALFVMSNPYITGSTITVDGGQTLA